MHQSWCLRSLSLLSTKDLNAQQTFIYIFLKGCHSLARDVFHGKRGELRQQYREGQEDQLSALGLVVNVIVLWNTLYIDAALGQLRREGFLVRDEDVARLLPFIHECHINLLGRYSFAVPEAVTR